MKPWKRYCVLFLALMLVLKVFSCRLVDYSPSPVRNTCPPMADTVEISAKETEFFLPLWAEYMSNGLNATVSEKISLISGDLEAALPWKVNFWLNTHCWTAKRFYYVEQRLRSIVRTLYLQEHTRAVKEILTAQMENETDEAKKAGYRNMIEMQDAIAGVEGISDEELEIVRGREQSVEDVLNGKSAYNLNRNK